MTQELLTIARELRAQPPEGDHGICRQLEKRATSRVTRWCFQALAEEWPEFSGAGLFPVPSPASSPADAYASADAYEMWSPDHPYGAARLHLLDFIIQQLEEEYPDA